MVSDVPAAALRFRVAPLDRLRVPASDKAVALLSVSAPVPVTCTNGLLLMLPVDNTRVPALTAVLPV